MSPAARRPAGRRTRLQALLAAALSGVAAPAALAQATWVNPGTASWLSPGNWSTGAVPGAGQTVRISNGGTALLSGIAQTPLLSSLLIGDSTLGSGRGTLLITDTALRSNGSLNIGTLRPGSGTSATGRVDATGSGGQVPGVFVGNAFSATVTGSATGVLDMDGSLTLSESLYAGDNYGSRAGSSIDAFVRIGGHAGTVRNLLVGEAFLTSDAQVGSRNSGIVRIGGNLALADGGFAAIGRSLGSDRVADPLVPGGARVTTAEGYVEVGGTLSITAPLGALPIGVAGGGVATGTLRAAVLDTGAGRYGDLTIGASGALGQATGTFVADAGDLRMTGALAVGTTRGGDARGLLLLQGGQLLGVPGGAAQRPLDVGNAQSGSSTRSTAEGVVLASGGIGGYTSYAVGNVYTTGVDGSRATGTVSGGSAGPGSSGVLSVNVGVISGRGENTAATGSLQLGNAVRLDGGVVAVGDNGPGERGSLAAGGLRIGGDAGTAVLLSAGNVTGSAAVARIGGGASAGVQIDGRLALAPGAIVRIGSTTTNDRAIDAGAPGGVRVNEARGVVTVQELAGVDGGVRWTVGSSAGGHADGTLNVGRLELGAQRVTSLAIGHTGAGQARGSVVIGTGDLHTSGPLRIGHASAGGSADGTLRLQAGRLTGDGELLQIGSGRTGVSRGVVEAAGGIGGYGDYGVGVVIGTAGAGTVADGRLVAGGAGGPADIASLSVGGAYGSGVQAVRAQGSVEVGHALRLQGAGAIGVGQLIDAGRDSVASGVVRIAGDAGIATGLSIGETVNPSGADRAGSHASGTLRIDGNLALAPGAQVAIGTAYGAGRAGDRVNRTEGHVHIGGTLTPGDRARISVGATSNGQVDGTLEIARAAMGAGPLDTLLVGVAGIGGQAQGRLVLGGGLLRAQDAFVGVAPVDALDTQGRLEVSGATLEARNLIGGLGAGQARLLLVDALLRTSQDLLLVAGGMSLERSFVEIADELLFGDDTTLHVEIDGLARRAQYGAIDAQVGLLAGRLELDFADLVFDGDEAIFDLVRSGRADGLSGDFAGVSFVGVPGGYSASAGIEFDGVEVYRVRLARLNPVSEPGTAVLVLLALWSIVGRARSRRSASTGRGTGIGFAPA